MNQLSLLFRRLLRPVDSLLDRLTSYKLVLYTLIAYVGLAMAGSAAGKIHYHWYAIGFSVLWLVVVCRAVNVAIARFFDVPNNRESDLITALILGLILTPATTGRGYAILAGAGVVAMMSKYVLTIRRWHIFNPAALGAFISGAVFHHYASWWIGTAFLTPLVAIGGLLILRKMERFGLAIVFLALALLLMSWNLIIHQPLASSWHHIWLILDSTQIIFFATIMLPEPLTSPRQPSNYLLYGLLVAFLYGYARLRISPEQALLLGNIFAFLIEPQSRQMMTFVKRINEADAIQSYVFKPKGSIKYSAGQYMEWTVPGGKSDLRGNRRYFTLSSSPTEGEVMFSVKIPNPSSTFKRKLADLQTGQDILAAQVSGDFILPKSRDRKLAFIAGGIGITPFRSIVKYLMDSEEKRPIRMIYAANSPGEFAFTDFFKSAEKVGLQMAHIVTGEASPSWRGLQGRLDGQVLKKAFPDSSERIFYVSGPYGFVRGVKDELLKIGVSNKNIVSDYFPGYG